MRWMGHVEGMREISNAYIILVGTSERERSFEVQVI
jgi:hypothetical protein